MCLDKITPDNMDIDLEWIRTLPGWVIRDRKVYAIAQLVIGEKTITVMTFIVYPHLLDVYVWDGLSDELKDIHTRKELTDLIKELKESN